MKSFSSLYFEHEVTTVLQELLLEEDVSSLSGEVEFDVQTAYFSTIPALATLEECICGVRWWPCVERFIAFLLLCA